MRSDDPSGDRRKWRKEIYVDKDIPFKKTEVLIVSCRLNLLNVLTRARVEQ